MSRMDSFASFNSFDTFGSADFDPSPSENEARCANYVAPPPVKEWAPVLPSNDRLIPLVDGAVENTPGIR